MDIQLFTLYVGSVKRVVALVIDGRNPVLEFFKDHEASNPNQLAQLRARYESVADASHFRNIEVFKPLGDGLFEFRTRRGLRLYAFHDEGHVIIATSEAAASYLRFPATVILHGVDTARYRPAGDRDAELKDSGLPGRYAIGCFGRVRAQKGTDVFVEAICRLLPRYPDFVAVIIGAVTPDQRGFAEALKERVRTAGLSERVRFLGELPIDDVPPWYRRVLIYAFTSRNEGFGLTLLEAMASGAAVVAARAGAAETAVSDGITGVLVPPGDVDALERALEPLMRVPERAAAMGERGRERVVTEFSADAEADLIVGVYHDVLGRP